MNEKKHSRPTRRKSVIYVLPYTAAPRRPGFLLFPLPDITMEPLSPQVMHKLVFTILVHGLPESQNALALDVLAESQNNPNVQVREMAVVAISELPVPAAKRVHLLGRSMKDTAPRVRRRAARALGDFGPNALAVLPSLIAGLRDLDVSVRRDCAGAIGRLGAPAQAGAANLVALLGEPDVRTRVVAAESLKRLGRAALSPLLEGLHSRDPEIRGRCATIIGYIAPDDVNVSEALRTALYDTHEDVRRRAGDALDAICIPLSELVTA